MVCYVSTDNTLQSMKGRQLGKSHESLVSSLAKDVRMETKDDYCGSGCCSCCCVILMILCLSLGFLLGIMVGAMVEKNGYKITDILAKNYHDEVGHDYGHGQPRYVDDGAEMSDSQCVVRRTSHNVSSSNCAVCSRTRLLNVSLAGYADCNGLYSMSNLTSIWDSKRVVYQRISGGIRPWDKRYIYWNAHFFGEDFYGWSIGDSQSLVESGPFHSQGRAGVSNQPWQGSWRHNVSVKLSSCLSNMQARMPVRYDKARLKELQRAKMLERELHLLRTGGGGGY